MPPFATTFKEAGVVPDEVTDNNAPPELVEAVAVTGRVPAELATFSVFDTGVDPPAV